MVFYVFQITADMKNYDGRMTDVFIFYSLITLLCHTVQVLHIQTSSNTSRTIMIVASFLVIGPSGRRCNSCSQQYVFVLHRKCFKRLGFIVENSLTTNK
jgi:hypothetical protein